jgi:hypothetical protein
MFAGPSQMFKQNSFAYKIFHGNGVPQATRMSVIWWEIIHAVISLEPLFLWSQFAKLSCSPVLHVQMGKLRSESEVWDSFLSKIGTLDELKLEANFFDLNVTSLSLLGH